MDMPDSKGKTQRQRLEFGRKTYPDAGFDYSELNPELDKPFPFIYKRAYNAWFVLAGLRREADPVNLGQIKDYIKLYRIKLCPLEVNCILQIDRNFIKYSNSKENTT